MKPLWMIGILAPAILFAAYTIKPSYNFLPFGNGMSVAVYEIKKNDNRLIFFYDHIYKQYDSKSTSISYLKKQGIRWGLGNQWLDEWKVDEAGYVIGTGIIKIKKSNPELQNVGVTEYYFMPMSSDKRIVVAVLELSNTTPGDTSVNPFLYVEAAMSSKELAVKKEVDGGIVFTESPSKVKPGAAQLMTMIPVPDSYAYKAKKNYTNLIDKQTIPLDNLVEEGSDLIGTMKYKNVVLKKGQVVRLTAVFALCNSGDDEAYIKDMTAILKSGEKVLKDEIAWWDKWHKGGKMPAGLSDDEKLLYKQSTAVLKMAQCREPGKPYGQILASMPPGQWNICWPRDASYSMVALVKSGHLAEAKACLEFMLNAPNGKFSGPEYVGKPYKISVCRYYGNGDEESDLNQSGPNLEWDDFGLFLWAFSEYALASKDKAFVKKYYPVAKELIADVLVHLMEPEGYLKPDSSIWERHWAPEKGVDGKKHFAYSTINAYNGLTMFAKVSPDKKDQKFYLEKAAAIKAGFLKHFITDDVIVVNLEDKEKGVTKYMDAAGVEAINFGMVDKKVANATLAAYEKNLKMAKSPGFFRNDDATWYDMQEWGIIDMRIAVAYWGLGNKDRADELFRWIVDNAKANFYLIPELFEEKNQSYQGAIPMAGFGAGTYILAAEVMKAKK
ncbi:MAG: hypothetical protein A2Y33_15610 [Spirochaetes bacterium GWF1_51_8]|nr:MAG: hypothetical protein A2Y33_15610 [Spirochaetes bacterium GWF1_51_8]